jgi:hypothetical protein
MATRPVGSIKSDKISFRKINPSLKGQPPFPEPNVFNPINYGKNWKVSLDYL